MATIGSTLAGCLLLAVASVLFTSVLRIRGRAACVAAAAIVAAAIIVAGAIGLSALDMLTRSALLFYHAGVALLALVLWISVDRPRPPAGWRPHLPRIYTTTMRHQHLALLVGVATLGMAVQFILAVWVAPSNWDSMTYHLSRAAYWLQQESATHIPGGSVRQINSPPNAELLQAWTMAMTGTDRFVGLVQWLAALGTACCIYLTARLVAFSRPAAAFAAALFLVLPQPVLQASSTQNDLVAALFVAGVAAFGLRGALTHAFGDFVVAALALGLAVGTKGTVFALAPALAVLVGVTAWRARLGRKLTAGAGICALIAIAVLGSWGYALNLHAQGSPFGDLAEVTGRQEPLPKNAVRVLWTLADAPGVAVPWVGVVARHVADPIIGSIEIPNRFGYGVDSSVSEDTSAYGVVGWLALLPILLYCAFARGTGARRLVAVAGLLGLACFAILFEYNIWIGRLLLPTVALAMPLAAVLFWHQGLRTVAVTVTTLTLIPCLILNPNKPLLVEPPQVSALRQGRLDQLAVLRPEMASVARQVNARIGAGTPLAFVGAEDSWDYPFFGAHRERRIVRFTDPGELDASVLRRENVRAVLFADVGRPAPELNARRIGSDYWLAVIPSR